MGIVYVRDLKVLATIGVFDWERRIRRPLLIDLEMAADVARAATTDDLKDALDYAAVTRCIIEQVEASQFHLVETLAEHLADMIQAEFTVPWLRLQIGKPGAVSMAREVGVIIERGAR